MTALRALRIVSFCEGLSFLLLLLVAMPLKYVWGLPLAVRIVGSLHGLLFVALLSTLTRAHAELDWPIRKSLLIFVLAILPFGFIAAERLLRREAQAIG